MDLAAENCCSRGGARDIDAESCTFLLAPPGTAESSSPDVPLGRWLSRDPIRDFTDSFIDQVEFACTAAIGRHDVNRVAKWSNEQTPPAKALVKMGTNVGHIAGVAGYD